MSYLNSISKIYKVFFIVGSKPTHALDVKVVDILNVLFIVQDFNMLVLDGVTIYLKLVPGYTTSDHETSYTWEPMEKGPWHLQEDGNLTVTKNQPLFLTSQIMITCTTISSKERYYVSILFKKLSTSLDGAMY